MVARIEPSLRQPLAKRWNFQRLRRFLLSPRQRLSINDQLKLKLWQKYNPPYHPSWLHLCGSLLVALGTSPPQNPASLKEKLSNINSVAGRPLTVENVNWKRTASKWPTTVFINHRIDGAAKAPTDTLERSLVNVSPSTTSVAMQGPKKSRDVNPSKIRITIGLELKQTGIQKLGAVKSWSPTGPLVVTENKIRIIPIGSKIAD